MDDFLILCHVAVLVDKGQLKMNCAVKIIQEITPVFKDGVLIFILCQLIVDVIKTDRSWNKTCPAPDRYRPFPSHGMESTAVQ